MNVNSKQLKKDDEEFNKMSNELLEIASDLDTANDALRALGWDDDYDDLEQAHEALKDAIRRDPKKAKELLENTPSRESDTLKYAGDTPEGKETDSIYEEFKGSGIDMYAALSDLGLDVFNTPESYLEDAFKEALFNSPKFRKKAKQYISEYRRIDPDEEDEEVESASTVIEKDLRRNMSTHVEDLVDYAKEDGYEAELESEEYMIVHKDGKEYRAHIDRAGDTYYVDRVEEL